MSDLLDRPLAFVDLETTGATATADRITEIGIVTLDGGVAWEWSQLINPEQPIPPFIQNLTGSCILADFWVFGFWRSCSTRADAVILLPFCSS